ncbi:retrovirus-related Pol polyprotein from transposon 297 [Trichonephila clavipes]|nr:retrovirus-related Pol polyprotein from transposon 297 [Trichonephila clavipes]
MFTDTKSVMRKDVDGNFVRSTDISTATKTNVKYKIYTVDHAPIYQRAYRVSPTERRIIHEEVQKMLDECIVQPSNSPCSSTVVLVRKKDGSWYFCVDYRKLNRVTKKDVYHLHRIDDTLDCLKGAKFFSSMDLRSGYWQIEIDEEDREKATFITPEGLYEFKDMPFDLCNVPATFERMMGNLLRSFKWTMCLCYLDDIIVISETLDDHLIRLRLVLKCLQKAGIKFNAKKCLFAAPDVKILGHLVSSNGVHPDPDKSLLKSGTEFHRGPEDVEAFNSLKKALTSDPVLRMYDESASTEIHTDASGYSIGTFLVQIQNNVEKVIAYTPRTLTKAEKNYSTTERECQIQKIPAVHIRKTLYCCN